MAESWNTAFGRYLKMLRERRGLSLNDVSSLSQTFPENINRGYLSRCENGHQKLALPKLVSLSRIYETPADVLVERLELDMELDRVGGPDTDGLSFGELTDSWKKSQDQGFKWPAYGYARDAIHRSPKDPVVSAYRDTAEQVVCSQMNCASSALSLGKFRLALHEFRHLRSAGGYSPRYSAVLLERVSTSHRRLGDLAQSEALANAAVAEAEAHKDVKYLGYLYASRALLAAEQDKYGEAATFFHKTYRAYRNAGLVTECATTLNNLAQCYFSLRRLRAAKRALAASQRISTDLNQRRCYALSQILLGEIDELEERPEHAAQRWRKASKTAKELDDKVLRFQSELPLFRLALSRGNSAVARAIGRRLRRLAPLMPDDLDELHLFKELSLSNPVSASQRSN